MKNVVIIKIMERANCTIMKNFLKIVFVPPLKNLLLINSAGFTLDKNVAGKIPDKKATSTTMDKINKAIKMLVKLAMLKFLPVI